MWKKEVHPMMAGFVLGSVSVTCIQLAGANHDPLKFVAVWFCFCLAGIVISALWNIFK